MLFFSHSRRSSAILAFFLVALLLLLWKHEEAAASLPSSISGLTPAVWSGYLSAGDIAPLVGTANATLGVRRSPPYASPSLHRIPAI